MFLWRMRDAIDDNNQEDSVTLWTLKKADLEEEIVCIKMETLSVSFKFSTLIHKFKRILRDSRFSRCAPDDNDDSQDDGHDLYSHQSWV